MSDNEDKWGNLSLFDLAFFWKSQEWKSWTMKDSTLLFEFNNLIWTERRYIYLLPKWLTYLQLRT